MKKKKGIRERQESAQCEGLETESSEKKAAQTEEKPPKKHRWGLIFCGVALIVMMVYLFVFNEFEALTVAFRNFRMEYFAIMLLLMVIYWFLEALSIYVLLHKVWPKQTLGQTVITTMIGQYYNCITPLSSGGQPMQAYYMARYGTPASASMTVLLARLIIYEFTLTAYSAVVLIFKLDFFMQEQNGILIVLALIGFAMNAIGIFLFLMLAVWRKGTVKAANFGIHLLAKLHIVKKEDATKEKVDTQLDGAYQNMRFVMKRPLSVLVIILITVVQLTIFYGISFVVYRGFSGADPAAFDADFFTVLSSQSMVSMVSAMFPLPGAMGLSESSYNMYFNNVYPENYGTYVDMSMIIWRFMTFYLQIFIGIVITIVLSRRSSVKTEKASASAAPVSAEAVSKAVEEKAEAADQTETTEEKREE